MVVVAAAVVAAVVVETSVHGSRVNGSAKVNSHLLSQKRTDWDDATCNM
jgi:hypothetical protein